MGVEDDDYWEVLRDAGVLDDDDEFVIEEEPAIKSMRALVKKKNFVDHVGLREEAAKAAELSKKKKIAPPKIKAGDGPKPSISSSSTIAKKKKKKRNREDSYDDPNWERRFLKKKFKDGSTGEILSNTHNAALVFSCDPRWKGVLAYDELLGDIVALKPPPWHSDVAPRKQRQGEWTDSDTVRAEAWITREHGFSVSISSARSAIQITAERHSFHPVRRWFRALEWDGKPRLDTFLIRLAGAEDNPYVRAVTKNFLIGAVARAMEPGCQVDSMPIFEGAQGVGKSSMLRILGGSWFMETTIQVGDKDSYQVLKGMWIIEWGEMGSMTRSEVNLVKQYVSERISRYRPSFGSRVMDFPRQCVFAGTTNPTGSGYLKDTTGARRFNPVTLGKIDLDGLKEERGQLFAEAYARYLAGEEHHLKDEGLVKAHAIEAEKRRQKDPWEEHLAEWLPTVLPRDREAGLTTFEVLNHAMGMEVSRMTRGDSMKVAEILKLLGWSKMKRSATERRYCPKNDLVTPFVPSTKRVAKEPKVRGFGDPSSGTFKKPSEGPESTRKDNLGGQKGASETKNGVLLNVDFTGKRTSGPSKKGKKVVKKPLQEG